MKVSFAVGGPIKQVVDSIVTSNLPPEELLKSLDSYGIDWYLTDAGDLMIRYWQIGADNFVPAERVGRIQAGRELPSQAYALEWLSAHLPDLRTKYAGQWIAVIDNQVAVFAKTLPELLQQVRASGLQNPFITQIPASPLVWNTAYAN